MVFKRRWMISIAIQLASKASFIIHTFTPGWIYKEYSPQQGFAELGGREHHIWFVTKVCCTRHCSSVDIYSSLITAWPPKLAINVKPAINFQTGIHKILEQAKKKKGINSKAPWWHVLHLCNNGEYLYSNSISLESFTLICNALESSLSSLHVRLFN